MNDIKNLKLLREQGKNGIKNQTRGKLNILDDEINHILEKLYADLTKCIFFENPYDFECVKGEREKRILANQRKREIARLKEEAEINKGEFLDDLTKEEKSI